MTMVDPGRFIRFFTKFGRSPFSKELIIYRGAKKDKVIYLTFDDGPHPKGTPIVLEALSSFKAKATFFLMYDQVVQYPELTYQIIKEDHTVGMHGVSHQPYSQLENKQLQSQFELFRDHFQKKFNYEIVLVRPPYSLVKYSQLKLLKSMGALTVLWNVNSHDYELPPEMAFSKPIGGRSGDIVSMHETTETCWVRLKEYLKEKKSLGYEFKALRKKSDF